MGWRTRRLERVALVCGSIIALAACSGGSTGGGSSWQSVSTLPPSLGGRLSSITVQGSSFFAAGYRGVRGPGIVWSSANGQTWTAAPDSATLATSPLRAVTTGPKGLLALGNDCSGGGECGLDNSGSFLSADGTTWTPGGQVSGNLQRAWNTAWASSQFVAVGSDGNSEPDTGRITTSPDGMTWTMADVPSIDASQIQSVAAGKQTVVAVGHSQLSDGTWRAASWASTDGQTWKASDSQASLQGGDMLAVVAGGPGFVAVGTGADGAAAWTSTDGLTWTAVADGPDLKGATMDAVATTSNGLVAAGYDSDGALVWSSTDGSTWSQDGVLPNAAKTQATAVASIGSTVVVVGGASPAGTDQAYIWVTK
jgi:hypothetical protein